MDNQDIESAVSGSSQIDPATAISLAAEVGAPLSSYIASGNPPPPNPNNPNNYGGGGYGVASGYAPYAVGNGMTKWDEFVQQMQLENAKLSQAKQLQEEQLAQQKALQEQSLAQAKELEQEKLAEEQKIADQNTVQAFDKDLMAQQGPKDPYGYLFSSRGLSAPQGYSPTPMALPPAVLAQYQAQGIDLATAQKQVSGSSGPSFINGYLGSMAPTLQQGPMGFQNTPTPSSSQPSSGVTPPSPTKGEPGASGTGGAPVGAPPPGPTPTPPAHMASGGVISGYAPGRDTVPAMLSPGEGVLTPQAVSALGGPSTVGLLNTMQPMQHFASGGVVEDPDLPHDFADQATAALSGVHVGMGPVRTGGPTFPINANPIRSDGPGKLVNTPVHFGGGTSMPVHNPIDIFNPNAPSVLHGGVLQPTPPPNGPPMNLNMLDPYTRSMVDEFGRPQIPSAQALASMPQSGLDAFQNYVEKVAGGNFQDLLDQSKRLNSDGASTTFSFT